MKKTFILAGALLVLALAPSFAITADEVVEKAKHINDAKTTQMEATIVTKNKSGKTSEMLVRQYGSEEGGISKAVIEFLKPANIAGTRFLVVENPGKDEDRKIYLPELGKVRRIASSEGGGSFMGTDFTYDDISSSARETTRDNHTLAAEETVDGQLCYVIESVSKKTDDSQYSKSRRWVTKDKFLTVKTELFDKAGKLIKTIEISKYEDINGYTTPMVTKVSNVQEGSSTTMTVKRAIFDKPIPSKLFTENYLKTGKV